MASSGVSRRSAALLTRMSRRPKRVERGRRHRVDGAASVTSASAAAARAARALDRAHHLVGLGLIRARVHDDRGAGVRKRERDRAADVAAGAGHQRHAAVEFLAFMLMRSSAQRLEIDRAHHTACAPARARHSARSSLQPPWRQLSANFSSMSARVSGSCAPPRRCGWRSSTRCRRAASPDVAGEVRRDRDCRDRSRSAPLPASARTPGRAPPHR